MKMNPSRALRALQSLQKALAAWSPIPVASKLPKKWDTHVTFTLCRSWRWSLDSPASATDSRYCSMSLHILPWSQLELPCWFRPCQTQMMWCCLSFFERSGESGWSVHCLKDAWWCVSSGFEFLSDPCMRGKAQDGMCLMWWLCLEMFESW